MAKKILLLITVLAVSYGMSAQPSATPKREVRAVWLTTLANLDWPQSRGRGTDVAERQKQELVDILDKYRRAGINTVMFQAVVRGTAVYPSAIYPWDGCMTGVIGRQPSFDPMKFAIDECHKRGMELHAWVVTLPVGAYDGMAARRLRSRGYKMMKFDGNAYLDPSQQSTVDLLSSVAREITTHYAVDGIHLDYIRYPEMMPKAKNAYVADWRRGKITAIVEAVSKAVKAEKPWVKVSCSPIGKYADLPRRSSRNWNARDRVSQNARQWLRLGLMDQLYPMIYFRGNDFYDFAADWSEHSYGKTVVAGLGTYFLNPREGGRMGWTLADIEHEMMASRRMGIGTAHFRSRFFTSNERGIYDFQRFRYSPFPALVPSIAMPADVERPKAPYSVVLADGRITVTGIAPYYNVYGSDVFPVDVSDARNIVLARHEGGDVAVGVGEGRSPRYFAVTAMDRYGNESAPVQCSQQSQAMKGQLACEDGYVDLQSCAASTIINESKYLEIRTMQGQVVQRTDGRKLSSPNRLNVSRLPNGSYQVYSVSDVFKHRLSYHRLGYFIIK